MSDLSNLDQTPVGFSAIFIDDGKTPIRRLGVPQGYHGPILMRIER